MPRQILCIPSHAVSNSTSSQMAMAVIHACPACIQTGEPVSAYGPGYLLLAPSPLTAGVGREVLGGWRLLRTADTLLLQTVHMVRTGRG